MEALRENIHPWNLSRNLEAARPCVNPKPQCWNGASPWPPSAGKTRSRRRSRPANSRPRKCSQGLVHRGDSRKQELSELQALGLELADRLSRELVGSLVSAAWPIKRAPQLLIMEARSLRQKGKGQAHERRSGLSDYNVQEAGPAWRAPLLRFAICFAFATAIVKSSYSPAPPNPGVNSWKRTN